MPEVERIYDEEGNLTYRTCNGPLCKGALVEASNFHKDKTKRVDGLYTICKDCVRHKKGQTKMQIRKREFDAEGNLIACECLGPLCKGKMHPVGDYWIVPGKPRVIGHCIACRKAAYEEKNPTPSHIGRVERQYDDAGNLTHKQCFGPVCQGKDQSVKNFNKNKSQIDGLESWCRACRKVHQTKPEYKKKRAEYAKSERGKASAKRSDSSPNGLHNAMRNKILREKRIHILPYTLTINDLEYTIEYFESVCPVCLIPQDKTLDRDHWVPISDEGCPGTVPENIVLMCRSCNRSKGQHNPYELYWDRPDIIERIEAFFKTVRED